MATTIARRLRRLGLLRAVTNENGTILQRPRVELSQLEKDALTDTIRVKHYARRFAVKKSASNQKIS